MRHLEQSIEEFNNALEDLEASIITQQQNIETFKQETVQEITLITSALQDALASKAEKDA